MAGPKVFRKGSYLIGCSGSARLGQLLQYSANFSEPDTDDLEKFLCTTFIDEIREKCKTGGHTKVYNNEETLDGDFLLGINSRIFTIFSDLQVTEYAEPYSAIGCGMEYSLGVLHSNYEAMKDEPKLLIKQALEAAEYFSIGVQKPFTIV